jgi:arginase
MKGIFETFFGKKLWQKASSCPSHPVSGGDHAVTYPVVRAVSEKYAPLNILHFDAHPDLYDALDNDRLSHACPFARIMETGRVARLVQVGIR